jgi:hypothetical protein
MMMVAPTTKLMGGFIKLNALRMRIAETARRKRAK